MKILGLTGPTGRVSIRRLDTENEDGYYKVEREVPARRGQPRRIDVHYTRDRDDAYTRAGLYAGFLDEAWESVRCSTSPSTAAS